MMGIDPEIVERRLKVGNDYPYDAPDMWTFKSGPRIQLPDVDWAHKAARGILYDFGDRRGVKRGFDNIDEDVRVEIVESTAAIIRLSASKYK